MMAKPDQQNWVIVPNGISVKTVVPQANHSYDLFNLNEREALRYGERKWGINLLWTDPASSDSVRFERHSGSKDPIKFEEPIAINIRGGKWLVYKKRDTGINLGWSDTPKFEWKVMGGNATEFVKTGIQVGLINTVTSDYLVYDVRDFGINLNWFKELGQKRPIGDYMDGIDDIVDFSKKIKLFT